MGWLRTQGRLPGATEEPDFISLLGLNKTDMHTSQRNEVWETGKNLIPFAVVGRTPRHVTGHYRGVCARWGAVPRSPSSSCSQAFLLNIRFSKWQSWPPADSRKTGGDAGAQGGDRQETCSSQSWGGGRGWRLAGDPPATAEEAGPVVRFMSFLPFESQTILLSPRSANIWLWDRYK